MDNIEKSINTEPLSKGYLVVRVSTARGAIPLENASVIIRASSTSDTAIRYSLLTNSDGITAKVSLETPSASASSTPENTPYSLWNVDVFLDGYIPVFFQNVPVYPNVVSVQPAVMIPTPERFSSPLYYNETVTDTRREG